MERTLVDHPIIEGGYAFSMEVSDAVQVQDLPLVKTNIFNHGCSVQVLKGIDCTAVVADIAAAWMNSVEPASIVQVGIRADYLVKQRLMFV